ncbi:histamine H3 receptor [Pelobates cultripes]|uniref:Histamine H3 receptor n=1 Tax=Pelobates cultripes TaxID=61616 RepID=A0AAD1SPH8_PELCU|nr:histamine H3 receptor [Pelobates cultripes]
MPCTGCGAEMDSTQQNWLSNGTWRNGEPSFHSKYPFSWTVFLAALMGVLIVTTVLGNALVMLAFLVDSSLRTQNNYFLLNLAISDFLVGALCIPLYVPYVLTGRWSFGKSVCKLWLVLDYLLCTSSVFNIVLISYDRFISVTRAPHRLHPGTISHHPKHSPIACTQGPSHITPNTAPSPAPMDHHKSPKHSPIAFPWELLIDQKPTHSPETRELLIDQKPAQRPETIDQKTAHRRGNCSLTKSSPQTRKLLIDQKPTHSPETRELLIDQKTAQRPETRELLIDQRPETRELLIDQRPGNCSLTKDQRPGNCSLTKNQPTAQRPGNCSVTKNQPTDQGTAH